MSKPGPIVALTLGMLGVVLMPLEFIGVILQWRKDKTKLVTKKVALAKRELLRGILK